MKKLSVVIPAYNSASNLPELIDQLNAALTEICEAFEVIVVDDGSRDNTWNVLCSLGAERKWLKPIRLMRNFGQHNALLCGVRAARFGIIITMDDDLQQSPASIKDLLSSLEQGFDVVYGYPQTSKHSFSRNLASEVTKVVLQRAMGSGTARHISPFRAFRAELRDCFANYSSPSVNLDVLLSWGTTNFTYILVPHDERKSGRSGYTFAKLVTHAINMLTGFSVLPLQLASVYGGICMFFGILAMVGVLVAYFTGFGPPAGFPFLASIIIIFSGAQLLTLGIFGEYLARMYVRMTDKPAYIVRSEERLQTPF